MPDAYGNGIRLHYEVRGEGDPLVLLMGLGADGGLWEEHVQAYERHFRCVIVDNRGAGRSDAPTGPYTTAMMAADTVALMDALGIEKAHVAGISMGGAIAQEIALLAPTRVAGLVIVSSWAVCDVYARRIFELLRAGVATLDGAAFTRLLQLWIFTPAFHAAHEAELLRRERLGAEHPHPMSVPSFQAQCDACLTHDTRGRLGAIRSPALVTVGDRDIFTPPAFSQELAEAIPGAELAVFAGGGHAHHWEQLEAFNRRTTEFLLARRM